jgi:hypothetical protein
MADKLWDLANIVTGFAIAHSLATVFMLAKDEMKLLHDETGYRLMYIGTTVFTLFYLTVILLCGLAAPGQEPDKSIWRVVTVGRILAVTFFTFVLYGTIYGHRYFKTQEKLQKLLSEEQNA